MFWKTTSSVNSVNTWIVVPCYTTALRDSCHGTNIPEPFNLQNKYHIKLFVPGSEGGDALEEIVVKCDTELQYAQWMAAFRLASKGMADRLFDK